MRSAPAARWELALLIATGCGGPEPLPTAEQQRGPGPNSCQQDTASCEPFTDGRPSRLSEHASAYSAEHRELFVFGGTSTIPEQCEFPRAQSRADLFVYSESCNGWRRVTSDGPDARTRSAGAFGGGRFWIFGGRTASTSPVSQYSVFDELWDFDPDTDRWRRSPSVSAPTARSDAALAWDPERDVLWLFGGNLSNNGAVYEPVADLWRYDVATESWTEQPTVGPAPPARLQHAMLLDASRDRLVVFGGSDESAFTGRPESDRSLWALDLTSLSWDRLADTGPQGRFWASLARDTDTDAYWLFGGHDDQQLGNRNDLWRFLPQSNQWEEVSAGDAFNRSATEFCAPPYDFATVDLDSPERRSAHTFVWSDSCGHGLLFGGKTDCGATDDVWTLESLRWARLLPATEGEVCWRADGSPQACLGLCR